MSKKQSAEMATGEVQSESPIIRANLNRETVTAPNFASLYANDTQVQVTPWDIRLIFGEITEPPTEDRPTVVVKLTGEVRMSPQHAMKLAMILLGQLKQYEQAFGQIPMVDKVK